MTERRFIITGDYGIVCREFLPDDERVTGVILGVHGFAGDKESSVLRLLAEELSKSGTALVCFDFPAHGESPAMEDYLTVLNCINDLIFLADYVRARYPAAQRFVFATSFGGYISLLASDKLSDFEFILRAPAVTMPKILLDTVLKTNRDSFEKTGVITCGFERKLSLPFSFLLDLEDMEDTRRLPLSQRSLIIHGTNDSVVPLEHILEYCNSHPDADLRLMEGADHRFKRKGELDCVADMAIDFIYRQGR